VHEPGRYDDEPALGNALLLPPGKTTKPDPPTKERNGSAPCLCGRVRDPASKKTAKDASASSPAALAKFGTTNVG
jgi:hypothetical protein